MKTIKKNYLILAGIATGFIQMFPIMYSLRGTYNFDTMLATYAWLAIILWGGLGWIAKVTNKTIQKTITIVMMISFGMGIFFCPWSPVSKAQDEAYILFLAIVMILTTISAIITTKRWLILLIDSLILGMMRADNNIAHSITSLKLLDLMKAITALTLNDWMRTLGFTLFFVLLIGFCLYLGEIFLGSKKGK